MSPPKRPSGQHENVDGEVLNEITRLWQAMEKQNSVNERVQDRLNDHETRLTVLNLKSGLWMVVGSFVATALWFIKDLFSGMKNR